MSKVYILPPASSTPRDTSDASRFGEVVLIRQPARGEFYGPEVVAMIRESLANFTERDYLVAGVGHPLSLVWTAAIAAEKSGGRLRLLYWNQKRTEYIPIIQNIYEAA